MTDNNLTDPVATSGLNPGVADKVPPNGAGGELRSGSSLPNEPKAGPGEAPPQRCQELAPEESSGLGCKSVVQHPGAGGKLSIKSTHSSIVVTDGERTSVITLDYRDGDNPRWVLEAEDFPSLTEALARAGVEE